MAPFQNYLLLQGGEMRDDTDWRQAENSERELIQDIEDAWSRLMADYKDCKTSFKGAWATEDDIKLLKWRLGVQ